MLPEAGGRGFELDSNGISTRKFPGARTVPYLDCTDKIHNSKILSKFIKNIKK